MIKLTRHQKLGCLYIFLPMICLLVVSSACTSKRTGHKVNEALLERLDSLVADNSNIIQEKETRINNLRELYIKSNNAQEKFHLSRQLYNEYKVYDSDSAMHYADAASKLLEVSGLKDINTEAQVKIDLAFSQAVQGRFAAAKDNLNTIIPQTLDPVTMALYYQGKEYVYSLESIYFDSFKDEKTKAIKNSSNFMDSIQNVCELGSRMVPWVPTALKVRLSDVGEIGKLSPEDSDFLNLKQIVDNNEEPSRMAATNAYWVSCFYRNQGNKDERVKYLAEASIYDAEIANREISALEELAAILFEDEDIDRAFNYLTFALNEVSLYKNSSRIGSISKVLNLVRNAYEEDMRARDKKMHRLIVAVAIVASILLISLVILYLAYRKLNSFRKSLADLNSSLKKTVIERGEAISELKESNEKLSEANSRNVGLLAFIFKLTTDYLGSFENYRKTLLVKFKGKQTADLDSLLNNPDIMKNQYQSFYRNLDKTILSVFPDFMDEYNSTAPDDQRMTKEDLENATLSTRMRIYGLKKLGIEKSGEIAQMLNISIRTVYNNR